MKRYFKMLLFLILCLMAIYLPTIAIKDLMTKKPLQIETDVFAKQDQQTDGIIIQSAPLLLDKDGKVRSSEKFLDLLKQDNNGQIITFSESSVTGLAAASVGTEVFGSGSGDSDDSLAPRAFDVSGGLASASPALFYAASDKDDDDIGGYTIAFDSTFTDEMFVSDRQLEIDKLDYQISDKMPMAVVPLPASLLLAAGGLAAASVFKKYY